MLVMQFVPCYHSVRLNRPTKALYRTKYVLLKHYLCQSGKSGHRVGRAWGVISNKPYGKDIGAIRAAELIGI